MSSRPAADGDRGVSRAERSERTSQLLGELAHCRDADRRMDLIEQVVLINRGVAEAVASHYRNRGVAREDLHQVAYEGLVKAVWRFDPALRNDLLTYAVPTIRGELRRYFRDLGWTIRPPRRLQELQGQVAQATEQLFHELGREPTRTEIIAALQISDEEYAEAQRAFGSFHPASLDQSVGESTETTLGDLVPDDHDATEAADARIRLAPVVRKLSERDRRILHLRFVEDRTQSEIGADLGVTQMQVSRLLTRILEQIKEELV